MNIDESERVMAFAMSAALGQAVGGDVRHSFGWRPRDLITADLVTNVRYGCLWEDFDLATASVLEQAPGQRPSVFSELHVTDAEDLGELRVVDPRGTVSFIRANTAVYLIGSEDYPGFTSKPNFAQLLVPRDPFDAFYAQVEGFRELAPGWNGFDCEPPNEVAIENARVVLDAAKARTLVPDHIVAGGESVYIYFGSGCRYANIECENDGAILALSSDRSGHPKVWVVDPSGLAQDLATISAYLA